MSQPHDMPVTGGGAESRAAPGGLLDFYRAVRATSLQLTETLAAEDTVVQTMPDVSPTKWHLAHTSWFFEHFVLREHIAGYEPFDAQFHYLFNSYYYTVGQMHRRPERGFITRPTLAQVLEFRAHVDAHMQPLLANADEALAFLVTLGLNHEQQHQELILTDIKHVFSRNPLKPALRELPAPSPGTAGALSYLDFDGGIVEIGASGERYCFDNETPRHKVLLRPFRLADRPVTNAEYREFIDDGGYREPRHWLSDGWSTVQNENWQRPLYWDEGLEREFTLGGLREISPGAAVCHLSLYEAAAFASWAGARLPTEFEWEHAAPPDIAGNLLESLNLHPVPAEQATGLRQMYGDVWEWTSSSYAPYPGFEPLAGSLGEYNGKFMCGQTVLRGGSCATPAAHIRPTYRNFFYPHQRWQFSGVRLAKDA